jgi:hypothetical protein
MTIFVGRGASRRLRIPCASILVAILLVYSCASGPSAVRDPATSLGVVFLDKPAAAEAIVDESLSPYFTLLEPREMAAKTGRPLTGESLAAMREECKRRYQAGVRDFAAAEKDALAWFTGQIRPVLEREYPRLGRLPWTFVKLSDKIEWGLPHTRQRCIVLSESTCAGIVDARRAGSMTKSYRSIVSLLIHEQVHVYQRVYPGSFDSLYRDVWGFEKAASIKGCDWLRAHQLTNPDAVDCTWLLPVKTEGGTEYILPLVVLDGDAPIPGIGAFRQIAITCEKTATGFAVKRGAGGTPEYRNLLEVPEYKNLFPYSTNIYHPHEASADMFAQLVLFDCYTNKAFFSKESLESIEKSLAPLRDWFKKNLQ